MVKDKNGKSETLTGVVTPVQWDGDQVTEVALFATDDQEYRIENRTKFFDLVQESIEATGNVQRTKKSFRTINIKKYRIL
jgi:environmental stress-induced protein Ves